MGIESTKTEFVRSRATAIARVTCVRVDVLFAGESFAGEAGVAAGTA